MPNFVNEWAKPQSKLRRPLITSAPARSSFFSQINARVLLSGNEYAPAGRAPGDRTRYRFDLVREQVNVAAGQKLSFAQDDVRWHGHAIECRVYAEDPENNFLPSPGRISFLRVPAGREFVMIVA
jgi:hypothetical protein